MTRLPWAPRGSLVLLLALFDPMSSAAARAPDAAALLPPQAPDAAQDLYLEVLINGVPIGLIAAFRQRADGTLAITPEELGEIGLDGARIPRSPDGLIDLARMPCVTYRYDSIAQQIRISAGDGCRQATTYSASRGPQREPAMADESSSGAVLNYSLYATTYSDVHNFYALDDHDPALSFALDTWVYGRWGTLSQTGTVSTNSTELYDSVRLDTRWSFSDQVSLITYSAGDVIGGGLAWTRPIRLGGAQVQRDFALRPDLITMPVPTLSGSAAVPSTVDVYANNVRVFSQAVPAGPFEIRNVPIITGAGMAQVVVHDNLGRDTVANVPYYASSALLASGLYDFSLEAGFPRTYYGSLSNSYDDHAALSGTLRYGVTDWLTLEAHAEGSDELVNGGLGLVMPVGAFGLVSTAIAGSSTAAGAGVQVAGGLELRHGPVSVNVRGQHVVGDYADLASVSAPSLDDWTLTDFGLPDSLIQGVLSVVLPCDPTTFTLSYTELASRDLGHSIIGASLMRPIFWSTSLVVSASYELEEEDSGIVYLGLSTPLGPRLSSNVSVSANDRRSVAGLDISKSETMEPGSTGWRLREREGSEPERLAAASYRGGAGRIEGRLHQYGDTLTASLQLDGGVALVDGSVYVADTITSGFAVVDTGAPETEVFLENRPVGHTDSEGRLLVTNLNPYQRNTISIDPKSLPLDAEIPKTKDVVVPGARRGAPAKFGITTAAPTALVSLTSADGKVLPPGLRATLAGRSDDYVVGYDGQVYLRDLAPNNSLTVELAEGKTCCAKFVFDPVQGEQNVIAAVCR